MKHKYPTRFSSAIFPIEINESFLETKNLTYPLNLKAYDLNFKFGLTPKMPTEHNKPLLVTTLEKHIVSDNEITLVKLTITYTYRLDIEDSLIPTNEEIFNLIDQSALDFAVKFNDLITNSDFRNHVIDKPNLKNLTHDLDRVIDFWQDSLRSIKVDEDGKPTDID